MKVGVDENICLANWLPCQWLPLLSSLIAARNELLIIFNNHWYLLIIIDQLIPVIILTFEERGVGLTTTWGSWWSLHVNDTRDCAIMSYYNLYLSVCWLWRPPCQAPCHRGRACRGFRNRASPVDYLDGDDHVAGGEDVDGDDNDNDLDVKKSHFHHWERICSCEITLGQKSVKEIEN